MDGAEGWTHADGLAGFEPLLSCLAPQVGMGGGGQHPPNPKPNVRAAPWACSVPLCVTAGLGTPGRGDEPDALLGWPWGHAGDASWLLGRVAHALRPGRWQGKGVKCAEVPSQEGATSATMPQGSGDSGQSLDGVRTITAQKGRVGQRCRDCGGRLRATRGEGCDRCLPGEWLLVLLPGGRRCPGTDLAQPGDGRYLQLVKPQRVSCFYFWVPQSPGMNWRAEARLGWAL